jgi:hypothetical protein
MTKHSPELNELAGALAAAQAEFVAIPKTDNNPFFKSKYAGLPQVVSVASPILTKHGLSVSQHLGHDDGGDTLATWLLHKSGQFICDTMRLHSAPAKGLSAVQGQGSATTYSRRYAYMAVLGLVADDDDDGQSAPPPITKTVTVAPTGPLATEKDVVALEVAAKDLSGSAIKTVLAGCGLRGVSSFRMVPANKVVQVAATLEEASK